MYELETLSNQKSLITPACSQAKVQNSDEGRVRRAVLLAPCHRVQCRKHLALYQRDT